MAATGRWMRQNDMEQLAVLFRTAVEHQFQGRPGEALKSYDAILRLHPKLAAAHCNRGMILQEFGRVDEALRCYDEAIGIEPQNAGAYYNRATALQRLNRPGEAVRDYDQAIGLKPDYVAAHVNRGIALRALKRDTEAVASFDRAVDLDPRVAMVHDLRGNALRDLRRLHEAIRSYDRALEIKSDLVLTGFRKGMCLLLMGEYEQGWPLHEWRKRTPERTGYREYAQPVWSGTENLEGRTLFVYAEQGLGDTIQFCRYAQQARKLGAKVVFAVQDSLMRLLKNLGPGIDVVGLASQPSGFDYHIALMSMPLAFRTTLANCPANVPYLCAEPERVEIWRQRLGNHGFRIGIAWQGNRKSEVDAGRSFPLRHFEVLAKIPGVRLISLQKNDGAEQLLELPTGMRIETLGDDFDPLPDAFVDTAAVMESLDLVISSDTAIAHLAGALGRPAWVALKYFPDWRWLLDRPDSPWYPTMRLFRQPAPDDWPAVFAAMESQLPEQIKKRSRFPGTVSEGGGM